MNLNKIRQILVSISIVLLIGALIGGWPYIFYKVLRIVVFTVAIFLCYIAGKSNQPPWIVMFGIIALLFNPVFPVHLSRNLWMLIDLFAIIAFAVSSRMR